MVDRLLDEDLGAGLGVLGLDTRDTHVALKHGGVHEACGIADALVLVVVDHRFPRHRNLTRLGKQAVAGEEIEVVLPGDGDPHGAPARGAFHALADDRVAADEGTRRIIDPLEQPAQSELVGREALIGRERVAAGAELHVDQGQARLDARHPEGLVAIGTQAVRAPGIHEGVEDAQRAAGGDEQLVAQVAAESGAADGHGGVGDLGLGEAEVPQVGDVGGERLEDGARAGPLDRKRGVVLAAVDYLRIEGANELAQIAEIRLCCREQELVGRIAENDSVLHDVARVIAPDRVLRAPWLQRADIAREGVGEELLGIATADPVLVQRRRVEEACGVADGEVLVLGRQVVARRGEVARPVAPSLRLAELGEARVEGSVLEHGASGERKGVGRRGAPPDTRGSLEAYWTSAQ